MRSPKVNSTLSPVRSPLAFVSTAAAASEEEMMMEEEEARLLPPRQQSPAPVAENKQEDLRMNASITENGKRSSLLSNLLRTDCNFPL